MKVLLVNPPYTESAYIQPPLGLAYLAAVLENQGHLVKIFDCPALKWGIKDYEKTLMKESFDIVGITAMTPVINSAKEVAKVTRNVLPSSIILLGGQHITSFPKQTMTQISEIDIGAIGEAEETIKELTKAISDKKNLKGVDGIIYRQKTNLVITKRRELIKNLDEIPFPARHLLPNSKYWKLTGDRNFTTILFSRGCPYNCVFCAKEIFGKTYRQRSVENLVDEIKHIVKTMKVKEIVFYDDTLTINREKIIKLCDELIKLKLDLKWKCETRVNLVDEELLRKMKQSGCYIVAFGVESAVQKNLDFLNKGITVEQTRKAFSLAKKAGLQTAGYFIFGIPGETKEEMIKTINFAKELNPDYAQFSILTPFEGTKLHNFCKDNGLLKSRDYSEMSYFGEHSNTNLKSGVSDDDLRKTVKKAYREFYLRPSYILKQVRFLFSPSGLVNIARSLKTLIKQ